MSEHVALVRHAVRKPSAHTYECIAFMCARLRVVYYIPCYLVADTTPTGHSDEYLIWLSFVIMDAFTHIIQVQTVIRLLRTPTPTLWRSVQ